MADWNDPVDTMTVAVHADTTQFQQQIADASRLGRQFGNSAGDGLRRHRHQGQERRRRAALAGAKPSQLALKAALKPLTNGMAARWPGVRRRRDGVRQGRRHQPAHAGTVRGGWRDRKPMTFSVGGRAWASPASAAPRQSCRWRVGPTAGSVLPRQARAAASASPSTSRRRTPKLPPFRSAGGRDGGARRRLGQRNL